MERLYPAGTSSLIQNTNECKVFLSLADAQRNRLDGGKTLC